MFDFSKLKKVAEDKHTTKFKHDDGHEVMVIHDLLPKIQRERLKRLPMYAEGGNVESGKQREDLEKGVHKGEGTGTSMAGIYNKHAKRNDEIGSASKNQAKIEHQKKLSELQSMPKPKLQGLAEGGRVKYADGSPDTVQDDQDQQPAPATHITINAASPTSAQAPTNESAQNFASQPVKVEQPNIQQTLPNADTSGQPLPGNQIKNIQTTANNQAAIDQATGKAQANTEIGMQQALAQHQKAVNDRLAYMTNHVDQFRDYINQNPIQADRRSVGSKVGDAFAIALSGVSGHGNPALDYLNQQLNRDFQAQKENVNNQNNILGAYERLYGNGVAADASTKATLLDLYDHKNKQTAAMLGTPQSQVNSQRISNQLQTQRQGELKAAAAQMSELPGGRGGSYGSNSGAASNAQQGQTGASIDKRGAGGSWDNEAQAMPQPGQNSTESSEDDLLSPNHQDAFIRAKYNPKVADQYSELQNQYKGAVQSQKAIDAVNKIFPELKKETTLSDYLAAKVSPHVMGGLGAVAGGALAAGASGALAPATGGASLMEAAPAIGFGAAKGATAGELAGHGIKQALHAAAGQKGIQFDADKAALTKIIAGALAGTNVSADQIQDVVDSNSPDGMDDIFGGRDTYNKKIENIKEFIRQKTPTDLTDLAGITTGFKKKRK